MADTDIRRVLMTTDTVGGVWTFTLELAEFLTLNGVEVVLAALGGHPSPAQNADASAIRNLCLLGSDFKLEWMDDPWADVEESGRWLMRLEREYRPDIVHLNSFGHGSLSWSSPVILTAHSCVLSWWTAVKGEGAPAAWDRYAAEVSRSLRSVALVTAPSAAMGVALGQHYGASEFKCEVIPNGRNALRFRPGTKEPFILSAGRIWDEAKNIAALARIAPGLPWPVFVAGDSQSQNIRDCRMLGRLSAAAMADWYSQAAIYVLPARYEPFGLTVLEAALSGCAVVLGDIPSLREIWGDAALFVSPDDPNALLATINSLISDVRLRETMSQRAYARARTFASDRMSQQYLNCYSTVVGMRSTQCVS